MFLKTTVNPFCSGNCSLQDLREREQGRGGWGNQRPWVKEIFKMFEALIQLNVHTELIFYLMFYRGVLLEYGLIDCMMQPRDFKLYFEICKDRLLCIV